MEGFMRKIYNFINGLEILHLIGELRRIKYYVKRSLLKLLLLKRSCGSMIDGFMCNADV